MTADIRYLPGLPVSIGLLAMANLSVLDKLLITRLAYLTETETVRSTFEFLATELRTDRSQIRRSEIRAIEAKVLVRTGNRPHRQIEWAFPAHEYHRVHNNVPTVDARLRPRFDWVGPRLPWSLFYGEVSRGAALLWTRLAWHNGKSGNVTPHVKTLAAELGVHRDSVIVWTKELVTAGLVRVTREMKGNRYEMLDVPVLHRITAPRDPLPTETERRGIDALEHLWIEGIRSSCGFEPRPWTDPQRSIVSTTVDQLGLEGARLVLEYLSLGWPEIGRQWNRLEPTVRVLRGGGQQVHDFHYEAQRWAGGGRRASQA